MRISEFFNKIEILLNISFTSGPMRVSPPKNQQIIAGIKLRFPQYRWSCKYKHYGPLPAGFVIFKDGEVIFDSKLGTDRFYIDLIHIIENLILEEKINVLLEDK